MKNPLKKDAATTGTVVFANVKPRIKYILDGSMACPRGHRYLRSELRAMTPPVDPTQQDVVCPYGRGDGEERCGLGLRYVQGSSRVLKFESHLYETSDPIEISFLDRKCVRATPKVLRAVALRRWLEIRRMYPPIPAPLRGLSGEELKKKRDEMLETLAKAAGYKNHAVLDARWRTTRDSGAFIPEDDALEMRPSEIENATPDPNPDPGLRTAREPKMRPNYREDAPPDKPKTTWG